MVILSETQRQHLKEIYVRPTTTIGSVNWLHEALQQPAPKPLASVRLGIF